MAAVLAEPLPGFSAGSGAEGALGDPWAALDKDRAERQPGTNGQWALFNSYNSYFSARSERGNTRVLKMTAAHSVSVPIQRCLSACFKPL